MFQGFLRAGLLKKSSQLGDFIFLFEFQVSEFIFTVFSIVWNTMMNLVELSENS